MVTLVTQPKVGTVTLSNDGSFTFQPGPASPTATAIDYMFTYKIASPSGEYGYEAYGNVTLTPRTIDLDFVDPKRKATKIIILNADDDKNVKVEDRRAAEVSGIDNDWVEIKVTVSQPSANGTPSTEDDPDKVFLEARPRDVRLWYKDGNDFKLLTGPVEAEKVTTVYADAIEFASKTVTVSARFEDQWEEVEGASPGLELSVIYFEQFIAGEGTVDEVLAGGITPVILPRTNGDVDWKEVASHFTGSSKLMLGSSDNVVSTASFDVSNVVGSPTFQVPLSMLRFEGQTGYSTFRVKSQFAGAEIESDPITVLPGSAAKFRIVGSVRGGGNSVYPFTFLDEIQDIAPMPTSEPPNFSLHKKDFLTLHLHATDVAGNYLANLPFDSKLIGQHTGGSERVAGNNLPFQSDNVTQQNFVGMLTDAFPIDRLPGYSQLLISADSHRIARALTGGELMLGWDFSNPSVLYFDDPKKLTLKVWVNQANGNWAANGTVVEWSDSKGFLKGTSTVENGRATIDYKLPSYGLFLTPEQALGKVGVTVQAAGYSTTGFLDIKLKPTTIIGSSITSIGQVIAGNLVADQNVPVRSTEVLPGGSREQLVEDALSGQKNQPISVQASQPVVARKLLPNRDYRIVLDDPTEVLQIEQHEPGNGKEKRFTTGGGNNEEFTAIVSSKGNMPQFEELRVANAVAKLEIEIAHEVYELVAGRKYPLPPIPIIDFVWSDTTLHAAIMGLFKLDALYPELSDFDTRQKLIDVLNSMKYSAELGIPWSYKFYTGVPNVTATNTEATNPQLGVRQFLAQAVLKITSKEAMARYNQFEAVKRDFIWGAFAGSDDLDVALLGDVVLGVTPVIGVWTDIRDVGKNALRLLPVDLGMGRFDWREMTIAALGIATEFLPPADLVVDGFRTLYKIGKASAPAMQFFLALEPLFTPVFKAMLAQPTAPPVKGGSGGGGHVRFGGGGGADTVAGYLSKIGLDSLTSNTIERLVHVVEHLGDADFRRVLKNLVLNQAKLD